MILLLASIVFLLVQLSLPIFKSVGASFFVINDWNPPLDIFGALPFIYGTLVSSLLALLIAAPISIGVALFLTELAPKSIARVVGFLVEMLAAIPSIVYGLWGIFILAPFMQQTVQPALTDHLGPGTLFASVMGQIFTALFYPVVLIINLFRQDDWSLNRTAETCMSVAQSLFAGPNYGVGMFTAALIISIMITPTIASISRDVFKTVSPGIREASLALGATRWEMIKMAVLRTARSGIIGAMILGLGRALGETMAVAMVIGNRNEIKASIMAPAQTMASVIANEYNEASGLHMSALAAVGLALFFVSLGVNSVARFIIWNVERNK